MGDSTTTDNTGSGRTVASGRGVEWWSEAWALFMKAAGMWLVLSIIMIIIFMVLGFIPILGGLAVAVLFPVFMASWLLAARKVEGGGTLEPGDLFTPLQGDRVMPLLILGAILLAFGVAVFIVAGLLGAGAIFGVAAGGADRSVGTALTALGAGFIALLAMLAISVVASMALWFAPALVMFRGTAPVDALKISFAACLRNIVPFLLWGLLYIVAAIVASIPFGLGWIVLAPLVMISLYVSYRDVFGA
ncbi:MAG: hypothetical protein KIT60_28390 [Burkholderiaceae bacterium]|nr:hypothetical protein [Burkholderiaceae bacterium]